MSSSFVDTTSWFAALVVVLVGLSVAGAAPLSDPLGTLVWVDVEGGTWQVKYHVFMPLGIRPPDNLRQYGTFSYDGNDLTASTMCSFMHPAFDHTGVRLFFSEGYGVKPSAGNPTMTLEQPTTRVWKFQKTSSGTPFAAGSGWNYVFHATPDHQGRFVFFNKFLMAADGSVGPGIHTYRVNFADGGGETLIAENALYPSISLNDRRLVFVRQLPNEEKLPETPLAMGLYYLDIDPTTGDPSGSPELVTPALGSDFTGLVDSSKNPNPVWRGPIRCGKPAIGPDEKMVVFALQDARFGTTDPSWNLWRVQDVESGGDPEILQTDPELNDFWPSVSSDGAWVAHMRHVRSEGKYKVAVTNIENPAESREPQGMGPTALWPSFDQDNDAPNLEVRLTPGDSNKPTCIKISDVEPDVWDGTTCKDKFKLWLEGQNFTDEMSTMHTPAATAEVEWTKDQLPAKLALTISTKASFVRGDNKLMTSFGSLPGDFTAVDGGPLEAMYLEEGARLKIEILARDGRYLRPNTGDMNPEEFRWGTQATNYHDNQWENSQTPSVPGRNVDPPYFPCIPKSAFDGKYPGVCWWIEDPEGNFDEGTDSAFYHIFRKPNYPASCPEHDPDKPYFLRIVAQDLWMNQVNIMIPIFVWDKKSRVNALETTSHKTK